ncbi:hypothetical protein RFM99_11065 [Mesorhizobium sp. VK4C]|uniref:hypothetical protein n=1 Tax=Mesorhizobium captivum TaxID=3072319 RepID=UPI002A24480F|nr:hypothetical protein [Mesorhizobium sp. VK4C]MDX8498963.1 hypothetical protein [Mesorhizobium sp. VK4C]
MSSQVSTAVEEPRYLSTYSEPDRQARSGTMARKHKPFASGRLVLFLAVAVAPPLATIIYSRVASSPIYASEVSFAIRSRDGQTSVSGLGALAGNLGVGLAGSNDIYAVRSYLQSPGLFEKIDGATGFSSSAARQDRDWIVRLPASASSEEKLSYYLSMVQVKISSVEQIVTVRAEAFSPEDARTLTTTLVARTDEFVNKLNERAKLDFVAFAESEVRKAEDRVSQTRLEMMQWRNANLQVDPEKAVQSQLAIITGLKTELANTRADISQMEGMTTDVQARMHQMRLREQALAKQVDEEQARIAGKDSAMATMLSQFERLQIERDLAEKSYATALDSLRSAQQEATQKQKYIVITADPSLPQDRSFPRPIFHTSIIAAAGFGIYLVLIFLLSLARDYRDSR